MNRFEIALGKIPDPEPEPSERVEAKYPSIYKPGTGLVAGRAVWVWVDVATIPRISDGTVIPFRESFPVNQIIGIVLGVSEDLVTVRLTNGMVVSMGSTEYGSLTR